MIKILIIIGITLIYIGKLIRWIEQKENDVYRFRNINKSLDEAEMLRCSKEQRKLVKIFNGSTATKHPRAHEIHAEEDPLKREIALIRILKDVWENFPVVVEQLEARERKLIAKTATMVKDDTLGDYGGTIEWRVEY